MNTFDAQDPDIAYRIIEERKLAFAFLNKMPITPGHILICPRRLVAHSGDLTTEEWLQIIELKEAICQKLRCILDAEGFNCAWNEGGNIAGQTVPHFHLHIVPRKTGDSGITQYDSRIFLYRPGTRPTSPKEELIALTQLLR